MAIAELNKPSELSWDQRLRRTAGRSKLTLNPEYQELKFTLHQRLIEELDPSKLQGLDPDRAREAVVAAARALIAQEMPGIVGAVLLLAVLAHALWRALPEPSAAGGDAAFGVQPFSVVFLNEYWLHFELTSVLLVAAVVAAIAVIKGAKGKHG